MKYLIILNDPPYGTEKCYNALRLAASLSKRPDPELRVFLMADSVVCGKAGQKTPQGYYNIERMVASLTRANVALGACGSCIDARGILESDLVKGVHRSTMEELTGWTLWADKVIVY